MRKVLAATAALVGVFGCGSTTSQFVGVWQLSNGSQIVTCGSSQATTIPLSGNETIDTGTSSGTISVTTSNCNEVFSVASDDTSATATNQTCPVELNGTAAIFAITSDTLTRSGNVLSEAAIGSLVSGGQTCSVVQSSAATRIDN